MKSFFSKTKKIAFAHKIISTAIIVALLGSGYLVYAKVTSDSGETRYVLTTVKTGTIISTVTGSGQVSASNQIDIKPKVSGDVIWVGSFAGQSVSAGQALASLDDTDARKAVATAELDLSESKLQFDKAVAEAPIEYDRKLESLDQAKSDLAKSYDDTFSTISNAFLGLPGVVTGLQDILYSSVLAKQTQTNIDYYRNLFDGEDGILIGSLADVADRDYKTARAAYDTNFSDFKNITRYSDGGTLEKLLTETINTAKTIAQAAKSQTNLLDTIADVGNKRNRNLNTNIATYRSNLGSYLGTINSNLSSLTSQKSSLDSTKNTITNTERDISILKINNPTGVNPIDLQISENNIKQKEISLEDLKAALADYVIRAPFAGIIAKVNIKKGDSVSSGTAAATIVTHQKIAAISLNEVDIAKIKIGQKVTLTFDAIEDLSITGKVSEIDTIGTVSQGVVSYQVQVTFDTQDERIKPGMTANVSIQTAVRPEVLVVPASAVKTQNEASYVQIFDPALSDTGGTSGTVSLVPPKLVPVEIGISDDTNVEIISGLKEGEQVVTRTITGAATASSAATRTTSVGGTRAVGGNAVFIPR